MNELFAWAGGCTRACVGLFSVGVHVWIQRACARSLYVTYRPTAPLITFAKDKGKLVCAPPGLQKQTRSLSPSYNHLLWHDIVGMPLVAWEGEDGGARCLPAVQGCGREQQQQLSGRDREPTAPSPRVQRTSLVLGEVCGWCCPICLKATVSSHLKQGQTSVVSYVTKTGGLSQPGARASLTKGSARRLCHLHPDSPSSAHPSRPKLNTMPVWFRSRRGRSHAGWSRR